MEEDIVTCGPLRKAIFVLYMCGADILVHEYEILREDNPHRAQCYE